ncbi:hypothetical protein ABIA31_006496 [Catenulispora sp. MAP5-51]|uniref:hypothetical protein n=1 Tax=Catenulispora sp. MAP5-51 TaxID=3156298 RepID=UPI003512FC51
MIISPHRSSARPSAGWWRASRVADSDLQPVAREIGGEDRGQALAGLDRDHVRTVVSDIIDPSVTAPSWAESGHLN